jgi:hypothetical protein
MIILKKLTKITPNEKKYNISNLIYFLFNILSDKTYSDVLEVLMIPTILYIMIFLPIKKMLA